MSARPSILLLASRLPYPPIGGDRLKNYNLLKILSKNYDVHFVAITEAEPSREALEFLSATTVRFKLFRKSKLEFWRAALRSLVNELPLQVNFYYFKDVQRYIDSVASDADVVYSTLIRTVRYVEHVQAPKILEIADSLGLNYKHSLDGAHSWLWKQIYRFETERLLRYEAKALDMFRTTLFFNRDELAYFDRPDRTRWIPHGTNECLLTHFETDDAYRNSVVFFGKMDVQHNIDAVIWFCKNVLRHLRKGLRFVIAGANPSRKVRLLARNYPNVEVCGFLKAPYSVLKASVCVVAPMQTGAGIQNKILESLALGTVVVMTSKPARAIVGARHGHEFMVADDAREMGTVINRISTSGEAFDRIRENAREFIRDNFTWQRYAHELAEVLDSAIADGTEATIRPVNVEKTSTLVAR